MKTDAQKTESVIFIQHSRMGRVVFEQKGCRLLVVGNRGPVKIDLDVDLRDIAPHVERKRWRSPVMILCPLGFASVVFLIAWALRMQRVIPYPLVLIAGGLFASGFLWTAIKNIAPFEIVTFRSLSGVPVFDVIKEKKQAAAFEEFVSGLIEVVRKCSGFHDKSDRR